MSISSVIAAVAVILAVWLLIKILALPVRFIIKLLINALCGFVSLLIVNFFGALLGFSLEIDLINCLVCIFYGFIPRSSTRRAYNPLSPASRF